MPGIDDSHWFLLEYVPAASYSVIQISARRNETGGRAVLPHTSVATKHTGWFNKNYSRGLIFETWYVPSDFSSCIL